jgi:CRP-like cAMP-binding protein
VKEGELGKTYADSEIIFKEGDKGETMYVVQSGKVTITKSTASGEATIASLGTGEIFGDMALFDKMPRSATARASGDARILSIDRKKLFTTISRDPTLVFKIIESMSRRIRKLNEDLMKLKVSRSQAVRSSSEPDDTCGLILQEAGNVIKSDNGSIMLVTDDGEKLAIKAAFGQEYSPKAGLKVSDGIAGDVMRTGKAEMINDVSKDPRYLPGAAKITSMMCVPLKAGDVNLGVINLSNTAERLFTLEDLKLLHALSVYASIAIHNAMSFSDLSSATDKVIRHATLMGM